MRNGFLGTVALLCAGAALAPAQAPPLVRLGTPVPLHEAVRLQRPVVADSAQPLPVILRTSASETPTIYRAAVDPLFESAPPPPPGPGGPPTAPPGPLLVPACPAASCDQHFWVSGEYLMWWVKNGPMPVDDASYGAFSGLRLNSGAWLGSAQRFGLEGSGFLLERRSTGVTAAGTLNVPPIVILTGVGSVSSSSQLYGAEANGLFNLYRDDRFHADLLGGFRYVGLQESLKAYAAGTFIFGGIVQTGSAGARLLAQNNFYGGQVGARAGLHLGRWVADVTGKVGLGVVREGLTASAVATDNVLGTSGFDRRSSHNDFAVVPEVEVRVGFDITRNLHTFVAYDFLYLSKVARPGNQNFASFLSPAPTATTTDFWAQGISFGLEFTY